MAKGTSRFGMLFMITVFVCAVLAGGCSSPSSSSQQPIEKQSLQAATTSQVPVPTTTAGTIPPTGNPTVTSSPQKTVSTETIRVDERDSSFTFSPGWRSKDSSEASGGTWAVTNYGAYGFTGIKVDIVFSGTGVALVYLTLPTGGIADITIDGKAYPSIDMYSNIGKGMTSTIATGLENTEHTLTISPSEKYNPSVTFSKDQNKAAIIVDAIEITRPT